jgi:hypothetical protein
MRKSETQGRLRELRLNDHETMLDLTTQRKAYFGLHNMLLLLSATKTVCFSRTHLLVLLG